ncbi:unnamed protein product [Prunus armeniaca]
MYLSISAIAISSMLICPHECAEHPMHYVSKGLQDAEVRYPDIEKLVFALVVSARRLRPYFQAHTIHVLTNQPLTQGCGASLILISPDKVVLEYTLRFKFHASNNVAEYEALLAGLWLANEMGAKQIQIFRDSQLVVHQVNQDFTAKDISMTAYLQHTRHLLATFDAYLMSQVPRSENSHADALARLASGLEQGIGCNIHIEFLDQPSTQTPLSALLITALHEWTPSFSSCKTKHYLLILLKHDTFAIAPLDT